MRRKENWVSWLKQKRVIITTITFEKHYLADVYALLLLLCFMHEWTFIPINLQSWGTFCWHLRIWDSGFYLKYWPVAIFLVGCDFLDN